MDKYSNFDFENLKIIKGKYWDVQVYSNQTCLGALNFWYKGEETDFLDIPKDALLEFYELGNKMKVVLVKEFKPDMFNYFSLNNVTKHLHVKMIPRYSKKISLFGLEFVDTTFGKSYVQNPVFLLNEKILIKIKDKIKDNI